MIPMISNQEHERSIVGCNIFFVEWAISGFLCSQSCASKSSIGLIL